jgi:hypothetical protein
MLRPYTASDICEALGISLDTLYRTRELRHSRDGLPRPMNKRGPLNGSAPALTHGSPRTIRCGHSGRRPTTIAPPVACQIEEHRARLRPLITGRGPASP